MRAIRATLAVSEFFQTHEVIGSSLLFVHDHTHASVWLIDFAKTVALPPEMNIDHYSAWKVGNHEDGYLIGINNLIDIFVELHAANEANEANRFDAASGSASGTPSGSASASGSASGSGSVSPAPPAGSGHEEESPKL